MQKHYYYGHAQLKDPTKKVSELKCQVKNVRAPRLEQLVLKCLKSVLEDPSLIQKWIDIYQKSSQSQRPEVAAELRSLEIEIGKISRKVSNLVQRVADLPSDLSADAFYEQIRALNQRKADLEIAKSRLGGKIIELNRNTIDQAALIRKIASVIQRIKILPIEQQRPIFKEIIHNIEIHPMKLKIEIYSPTEANPSSQGPETQKATGTDGLCLKSKMSDATVLPFDPSRRAGSSIIGNGASGRT